MRAGREPAEDVKRRMVAACTDAGLTVQSAWVQLQKKYGYRLIRVDAITSSGLCRKSVIGLHAAVGLDGSFSGTVYIGCTAGADGHDEPFPESLIMRGREDVPFEELAAQLRLTVQEREEVAAARIKGNRGPFIFSDVVWD